VDGPGVDQVEASEAERRSYMKTPDDKKAKSDALPWMVVEELVVSHKLLEPEAKGSGWARKVAAFGAVMALAVPIARASTALTMPSHAKSDKYHLV